MKKIISTLAVAGVVFGFSELTPVVAHGAQNQFGNIFSGIMGNFIDLNGDGLNDNAQDADGDGTPNGQDSDYVCPQTGTGSGSGSGSGTCDGTGPKGAANQGR